MTRDRQLRAMAYGAIALYAGWLAIVLQPSILADDAAITFRYVDRFTGGHGLTYNDHERVMGFSHPLYTLVLSLFALTGLNVETAARALGIALFAVVAVQAAALSVRLSGSRWGLLAGVLLPASFFFRVQALGGMESILAVSLALASVHCFATERDTAAALFLGFALLNKVDAAFLVLAVGVAWIAVRRRFPFRETAVVAAVVAPWLIFAWWYYGSPIPHSLTAKLAAGAAHPTNHRWIYDFFHTDRRLELLWLALAGLGGLSFAPAGRVRAAGWILAGWLIGHALAFSFLDLGDTYPWYLTVLEVPPIVLACCVPALLARAPWRRVGVISCLVGAMTIVWASVPKIRPTVNDLNEGAPIKPWEAFDADRRLAGIFLSQFADRGEIVRADFGWIAYEVQNPVYDGTGLNSERPLGPIVYIVLHGEPYASGSVAPAAPEGFVPLAKFDLASRLFPGYSWFVVYGLPDSTIAKRGAHLPVDVTRLRDARLIRAWQPRR